MNSLTNNPVGSVEQPEMAKQITQKFVECARIRPLKKKDFSFELASALREWALGQLTYGDHYDQYVKMRPAANALYQWLDRMIDMQREPFPNAGEKLDSACRYVLGTRTASHEGNYLVNLREQISIFRDGLDDAIKSLGRAGRARQKNLPPINGYPRLHTLVFALECAALRAGGTLTAHRKTAPKGRLIVALNELRTCLLRTAPALAEFLPDRDRHPIPNYERILMAARNSVRTPC